jgi:hypothetical protein
VKVPTAAAAEKPLAKTGGEAVRLHARPRVAPQPVFAPPVAVQRKCACGGGCPRCEEEAAREKRIQTKLTIGPVGDGYEQEADRVSAEIIRMPEPAIQRQELPAEEEEEEWVQMKPFSAGITPLVQSQTQAAEHLQPKLRLGASGDRYEQEADRTADAVMRWAAPRGPDDMPGGESAIQRMPVTAVDSGSLGTTAGRKRAAGAASPVGDLESRIDRSRGSGVPLPPTTRRFMESRFGYDFSGVRVHTGTTAEHLNRNLKSLAFTSGANIYFGTGQYRPDTDAGKHLLAHELTHVVQQSSGTTPAVQFQEGVDEAALEQCIAELGGSPGYRDAGLASPEELARYREECLRCQHGAGASISRAIENLSRAWEYAQERLEPEVRNEVANLFSPASLAAMAAFAALYIGSQFTPVGWIADAFALALLTVTVICVGTLVYQIARDLLTFFSAINATTEDELRQSGYALARALARGGVGLLVALLTRGMRGGARPRTPTASAPATALVEVVGVGRLRVPVTATTVGEAVQASRLQQLASYAVMVPPPGGTTPDSPSLSSSSGRGSGSGSREPVQTEEGGRGAGGTAGFSLTRIGYGEGPLSQLAQRLRLKLNLRRGGNVAVFEFENIPPRFEKLARRLGGENVLIEGNRMAVQNVSGAAHSEKLAHELIKAGRLRKIQLNVREIYTEYNPCTDKCLGLIQENYPSARVFFSFIWEHWGRQTPDRNAAVEALFSASRQGGSQ